MVLDNSIVSSTSTLGHFVNTSYSTSNWASIPKFSFSLSVYNKMTPLQKEFYCELCKIMNHHTTPVST